MEIIFILGKIPIILIIIIIIIKLKMLNDHSSGSLLQIQINYDLFINDICYGKYKLSFVVPWFKFFQKYFVVQAKSLEGLEILHSR